MGTYIKRDLPNDEYQAAVGANNPSASNVFATIADLTAGISDADAVVLDVKINQTGGINKGQAVYVNGASGTNILVGKADYSTEATSSKTLGLLITSGANNAFSKVITQGSLKGTGTEPLDTSAGAAGDPVWLGDDGNLIYGLVNKPYAPNHLVFIGVVVESNNTVGEIYVKTQNGFELEELHDVDLITNPPVDQDVLTYDNASGLWINQALPATVGENININLEPVLENTITDPSLIFDPNASDSYLVPIGAIGTWAGQDNNIATWDGEQWQYYTPSLGDRTTVLTGINAGKVYTFNGTSWVLQVIPPAAATPFYLAGSSVDAGANKTGQIARAGAVIIGTNAGSIGASLLTVVGNASMSNLSTRWQYGLASGTTINNWYRIASFTAFYGSYRHYQILVNIGGKLPGTWASAVLHINVIKNSPGTSTATATCRVVNISGPQFQSVLADGDFRLDESNFEFRRYANVGLGNGEFRLYYKPTVSNTYVSFTVLNNNSGGSAATIGINWFNTYLGAAIEPPAAGGSGTNFATFNYSGQRTNISAVVDPTASNDYSQQYTVGSLWYNTLTQKVFQCLSSAGAAAVWKQITPFDEALDTINFSSSQWSVTAPATNLPAGASANGFAFFTDSANKVAAGTTSYDEYFIYAGRTLTLTGTSGTSNIIILGTPYLATFNTSLTQTATDFVTTHQATLLALGIQVFANAGVLKFGKVSDPAGGSADLTAITITTTSGNLSGTFGTTSNDHLVIPYSGKPYFGQRLNHSLRVNFNINTGALQYGSLALKRWADDSQIGSSILIERNTTVTGQQYTFISYTAGATDPFVTGGFYFELTNNGAAAWTIQGSAGILVQTSFQKPLNF